MVIKTYRRERQRNRRSRYGNAVCRMALAFFIGFHRYMKEHRVGGKYEDHFLCTRTVTAGEGFWRLLRAVAVPFTCTSLVSPGTAMAAAVISSSRLAWSMARTPLAPDTL